MSGESFSRARTSAQRDQRREQILAVTREVLTGRRVADVSLNEIARQVGLAKSNVLRYFGSREAILLVLTQREYEEWVGEVVSAPVPAQADAADALAKVLAGTVTRHPLLCELLTCTATVLEHNVTPEEIVAFKLAIYTQMDRLIFVVEARLGGVSEGARNTLLVGIHGLITECWAVAHPPQALVAARALDDRVPAPPQDVAGAMAAALAMLLAGAQRGRDAHHGCR